LAGGPKGKPLSTFLSLPTPSDLAQPAEPESPVTNDGFFPDIDPAHLREAARIPTSITWPRLRAAILGAIMTVELDLRAYAAAQIAAGHATLAAVPARSSTGRASRSCATRARSRSMPRPS
jgi:hypothetical protein